MHTSKSYKMIHDLPLSTYFVSYEYYIILCSVPGWCFIYAVLRLSSYLTVHWVIGGINCTVMWGGHFMHHGGHWLFFRLGQAIGGVGCHFMGGDITP